MGYDLVVLEPPATGAEPVTLHLSVWEMSRIRDRMLCAGAAYCAEPPAYEAGPAARHAGPGQGIPAYKLAMIDGWIVVPCEIQEALCALTESPGKENDDRDHTWAKWLGFLRFAALNGGFAVE